MRGSCPIKARTFLGNNVPSLQPQQLGISDWYYEYPTYMLLVHEVRDRATNGYVRTDCIQIPWRQIKRSIERSYKSRKKPPPKRRLSRNASV